MKKLPAFLLIFFTSAVNLHSYAGTGQPETDNNGRIVALISLLGAGVLAVMKLRGMKKK